MSNLTSFLIQSNSCNNQNPIQSLNKSFQNTFNDRFHPTSSNLNPSSSSSSSSALLSFDKKSFQQTDQFINQQINQEHARLTQRQEFIPQIIGNFGGNIHHPEQDWSNTFLKSIPIQSFIPSQNLAKPSIKSNHWQSEFVNSVQIVENQHQLPINKFDSHHSLIQHQPINPSNLHYPIFRNQINHPVQSYPQHLTSHEKNSTDWDYAFSRYGLNHDNIDPSEKNTASEPSLQLDPNHQGVQQEYLIGTHSPPRSTSPDALARTAASLIATVENNTQLDHHLEMINPPDSQQSSSEKLIQSNFIDFMKKLRDGELKVEGDRLVQQVTTEPLQNLNTSQITDHHQAHNTHHLRQNQHSSDGSFATHYEQANRSFGMSIDSIKQPDNLITSSPSSKIEQNQNSSVSNVLDHRALMETYRHELENRMKEMNDLMVETDEELELAQYRQRMNAFQGDGGGISSSQEVDLNEILSAASQVDRPSANQSWKTSTEVPGANELWTEEFDHVSSQDQGQYFRGQVQNPQDQGIDDSFDPMGMFGRPILAQEIELERLKRIQRAPSSQQLEWAKLQNDWESMHGQEQTSDYGLDQAINSSSAQFLERIKVLAAETGYLFQQANQHFSEQIHRTKHHSSHQGWDESAILEKLHLDEGSSLDSVLQKEKQVLESPNSATAWYELGVKQQENEREELAIQALKKATQLDPQLSDAILALAISYANENQRDSAFEMIEIWINTQVSKVANYRENFGHNHQDSVALNVKLQQVQDDHQGSKLQPGEERSNNAQKLRMQHENLTQKLIQLARLGGRVKGNASVDPDVQIALGVLFNSNNEFQKACDCFAAALSVRPLDPLLFNRLGATFANSGKPEEAMQYYNRAIELLPNYIRARYNLSISLINLGKYFESLKNLINALIIQQSQDQDYLNPNHSTKNKVQPDTSSDVLWQTLEINCSLLRNELSSVQTELDECFIEKDLSRISKILVNFN